MDDLLRACVTSVTRAHDPSHARRWSSDHPHGKGQRSGGSSKRPKGGLGTSRGHPVSPPRGFGPVRGGLRGRRDGPQHEAPFLVPEYGTMTVKGLIDHAPTHKCATTTCTHSGSRGPAGVARAYTDGRHGTRTARHHMHASQPNKMHARPPRRERAQNAHKRGKGPTGWRARRSARRAPRAPLSA